MLHVILAVVLAGPPGYEAKVVGISDGDTLTVLRAGNIQAKIRLHGVDAPESGQDYGAIARRHLGGLVHGKTVRVEPIETDRYGRTVARVYLGGELISLRMVKDGMAWWYAKYAPGDVSLRDAEQAARKAKVGLWAGSKPIPPWEWRQGVGVTVAGVVGNRKSKLYHAPGCRGAVGMSEANRVMFGSIEDAEKAGYRKAGDCRTSSKVVESR